MKQITQFYLEGECQTLTYSSYSPVQLCESQKHFGVILDKYLNFPKHIERKIKIFNKLTGAIKHICSSSAKIFANDLSVLLFTTP